MDLDNPWSLLVLASGLLFLATAGYLIANLATLALIFGKRRRDADAGEIIADRRTAGRGAGRNMVKLALALHVIALAGLVLGALALTGMALRYHPDTKGRGSDKPLPADMAPVPQPAG